MKYHYHETKIEVSVHLNIKRVLEVHGKKLNPVKSDEKRLSIILTAVKDILRGKQDWCYSTRIYIRCKNNYSGYYVQTKIFLN